MLYISTIPVMTDGPAARDSDWVRMLKLFEVQARERSQPTQKRGLPFPMRFAFQHLLVIPDLTGEYHTVLVLNDFKVQSKSGKPIKILVRSQGLAP